MRTWDWKLGPPPEWDYVEKASTSNGAVPVPIGFKGGKLRGLGGMRL